MFLFNKKVALILVLSFLAVNGSHHQSDHAHKDHHPDDVMGLYDHYFHEHHHQMHSEESNCGQICPKDVPKFQHFEVGQVYTVEAEGKTLIKVKEGHTLDLKTKVDIQVLSPCEFSLKLRDAEVSGVPNPQELNQQLSSSPALKFGAHDGRILGVCPSPDEEVWTLNVKKALLSAMQITTKDLSTTTTVEEVDISGHCTTTYRPISDTSDPANIIIERTKNLNKCHLRRKNISGFQSKSLTILTEYMRENLPILESNQKCTQEIKNGHPFNVKCVEEQRVVINDNAVIVSTLNLKSAGKAPAVGTPSGPPSKNAESLLMNRDDEGQKSSNEADVKNLLKQMCAQVSTDTITPEITESYYSLMRSLRTLSETGTQNLDKAVKSGEICPSPRLRKLFLSASAFSKSDPSVQTIINAYNSKELSTFQAMLLLRLVTNDIKPTEKTIDKMVDFIETKDYTGDFTLGISNMVRNYCKKTKDQDCLQKPEVKRMISALIKRMDETDCDLKRIVSIKALDNIRAKSDDSTKSALLKWAQKSDADTGVRIAAIEALQRIADDNIRQKLIEILTKESEPTEVRITAYKSVVLSGPTVQQLESIKSVTDPQIQNYIRSHIKTLKKSSRQNVLPPNAPEFEEPRNYGWGVTRNTGFSYKNLNMEIDVIHPKGSVIPSLYTFGIWFPIGGKDHQMLEIQVRQEGLSQHLQKIISKGINGPQILMQLSDELLELMAFLKDPNHKHSVTLQSSVRLSSRNMMFMDIFNDMHEFINILKQLKETYKDNFDSIRGFSVIDNEVEVPSLMGFPMIHHINLTGVFGIKEERVVSGEGANRMRKQKTIINFQDALSAGMTLKVRNYRPGFEYKLREELYTTFNGEFERIDGRILKVKVNVPKGKQTLVRQTQSIRLIDANGLTKESNEIERRSNDDSTQCRPIFGLNHCMSQNWLDHSPIPNREIYINNDDPSLESVEFTLEKPPSTATRDLLVYTAKIKTGKRDYLAQFELRNPKEGMKKANLKLVSPLRTITADSSFLRSADGNSSQMEVDLKVPNLIDINTKYNVEQKGEQSEVKVLAEYQLSGSDRKETLKWNRKSSYTYKREKKSKQINASFMGELQSTQFPENDFKIEYTVINKPYQTDESDLKIQWGQQLKDKLRITHKSKMDIIELRPFQMVSENAVTLELTPLQINYEFKLNSDISMIKSNPKLIRMDLIGKDVEGRPDRDMKGLFKYERMEQPNQQIVNWSLSYPGRDMSYYSELRQIKDLVYSGKMIYSPQKGKVVTVEHKESVTNPTKDFHWASEAEVSYSYKPDKLKVKSEIGWETPEKFEYKHTVSKDDKKYSEWEVSYDKKTGESEVEITSPMDRIELKVDNIKNPRTVQWGAKRGPKSYKLSFIRVPKESYTLKLDSSENMFIKEFKTKVSRKEKSTFRMVTTGGEEINGYIDPISKDKKAHLDFKCPKHQIDHVGDIVYYPKERKLTWESKTNKDGKPYITLDSTLSPKDKSFLMIKKMKGDTTSKFECFYDKGVYAAALDTSRWSAALEGECKNNKNVGKLGFVDKTNNFEHKSQYNVSNGIITIKSVSDKDKQTFTKLDAIIGRKIISNITLITPTINAQLTANPLGEKKTMVFKLVSPRYDHNSNIEWVPRKYLKLDALSVHKVEPERRIKVDAYLTRQEESTFRMTGPQLDVDIRRVKLPKPKYIFNTTINGYNEVQEYDSNPSLTPFQNLMIAIQKHFDSYTSNN